MSNGSLGTNVAHNGFLQGRFLYVFLYCAAKRSGNRNFRQVKFTAIVLWFVISRSIENTIYGNSQFNH